MFTMLCLKRIFLKSLVWFCNTIYRICCIFGWDFIPLSIEDIIKPLARDERELLKERFSEPVKLIVEACNEPSSTITGFQRLSLKNLIRLNLKTVAAVKREIAQNPDILNTPVDGPLVIVGLARSGTTMLHRLLSCDPQFLSPMSWEMFRPTPPGRPDNWRETERFKGAANLINFYLAMLPDEMVKIHEIKAEYPEECIIFLGQCFMNTSDSILPDLRKWTDFQMDCPKDYRRQTYEYYKMALQCIFYKNVHGGKTILLKSPLHLFGLETYKEILPNAKFIFTYRHIETMLASSFSLIRVLGRMNGVELDRDTLTTKGLKFYNKSCQGAVKTFRKIAQDSYITMGYSEVMKDPLEAVRKIYDNFNLKLTPEVEASMQKYLADNPQNKHGKHKYSMEEFGVSQDDIKRDFAEFIEFFKDKPEKLL